MVQSAESPATTRDSVFSRTRIPLDAIVPTPFARYLWRRHLPRPLRFADLGGARPFGFHAPHWAGFIVADPDGTVWAFDRAPVPDVGAGAWRDAGEGGRFGLVGTYRQDILNWQEAVFVRRGGLWLSVEEVERREQRARLRETIHRSLVAIASLSIVVAAIVIARWRGVASLAGLWQPLR